MVLNFTALIGFHSIVRANFLQRISLKMILFAWTTTFFYRCLPNAAVLRRVFSHRLRISCSHLTRLMSLDSSGSVSVNFIAVINGSVRPKLFRDGRRGRQRRVASRSRVSCQPQSKSVFIKKPCQRNKTVTSPQFIFSGSLWACFFSTTQPLPPLVWSPIRLSSDLCQQFVSSAPTFRRLI